MLDLRRLLESRGIYFPLFLNKYAMFWKQKTVVEVPVEPALRVAICLYRLGRGTYYQGRRKHI